MIALWMMYAVAVTAILATAAALLDVAARAIVPQRRWIWVLALGLSAGIPAWTALAPRTGLMRRPEPLPGATRASNGETGSSGGVLDRRLARLLASTTETSLGKADGALTAMWIVMACLAVTGYGVAAWSLARRRRSWRAAQVDGQAVLLAPATGPAVVGTLRPTIVVPEWSLGLASEQRALMLEHERQHVLARDPLMLHAAAFVVMLMPWNVLAWWLNRRLRLAVELDCDARVLASGRDARAYGALLLDVCARHLSPGVAFAPALFERTSSLTRRIIAMNSDRPRFAGIRLALGIAGAVAVVAVACDMPSPEVVAPDGKNHATARLYGELQNKVAGNADLTKAMVAQYFPSVARGEGGPAVLFLVKSASGEVVFTDTRPANELVRTRRADGENVSVAEKAERERALVAETRARTSRDAAPGRVRANVMTSDARTSLAFTGVPRGQGGWVPTGINGLRPDDINTIDVSKRAPGTVAPNGVSLITITLKPGAAVPTSLSR